MAQSFSKISIFSPIPVSCHEYVHPWTDSCMDALCGLYFRAILYSLKMYATVYMLSLVTRGKFPSKIEMMKTIYGILQSTAFLSGTGFGYSAIVCLLRRTFGGYNFLTVSFFPAFLSSVFSILIERPNRRTLLALYVTNVATETVWNMLLSRDLVENVKFGCVGIFALSSSLLLTYYKAGWHKKDNNTTADPIFGILRFIVGPYEEKDYVARSSFESRIYRQEIENDPSPTRRTRSWCSTSNTKNSVYAIIFQALRAYKSIIEKIKCCDRYSACPHPFSCLYYTFQGTGKMFSLGLGIQVTIKLLLNLRRIINSPRSLKSLLIKNDMWNLAICLGGFSGLFRAVLCLLRRGTGKDLPIFAFPAGAIAGMAFFKYPDTTVALYIMWKMLQISYNIGVEQDILPKVPGFAELLYCLSTGLLFHVAIIEPTNLRPSYWKFLHGVSGGRIACMSRVPIDAWGYNSSEALSQVLQATKTRAVLS